MNIEQKLEAATAAHEKAIQALATAREHYTNGPGKVYTEVLQKEADLKGRLAGYREEVIQAEAKFKEAMAKADYKVTKEVRAALNAKNDANAIADEISEELQRLEMERMRLLAEETGSAARSYHSAYCSAARAAMEFHTYTALATAGREIAKAMALVPYFGSYQNRNTMERLVDPEQLQKNFVVRELTEMAKQFDGKEYRHALGGIDLGPLKLSDIPSPVQAMLQLRELNQKAAEA